MGRLDATTAAWSALVPEADDQHIGDATVPTCYACTDGDWSCYTSNL